MVTNAQRIREFQKAIAGAAPAAPTLPPDAVLQLRQTLLREEHQEVMAAFALLGECPPPQREQRLVELIHELTDLLYVTYGAIVACGVDPDPVFAEVHRANMQKAGGPRRADGKVLKPPDFRRADVAAVIEAQRQQQQPV